MCGPYIYTFIKCGVVSYFYNPLWRVERDGGRKCYSCQLAFSFEWECVGRKGRFRSFQKCIRIERMNISMSRNQNSSLSDDKAPTMNELFISKMARERESSISTEEGSIPKGLLLSSPFFVCEWVSLWGTNHKRQTKEPSLKNSRAVKFSRARYWIMYYSFGTIGIQTERERERERERNQFLVVSSSNFLPVHSSFDFWGQWGRERAMWIVRVSQRNFGYV